MFLTTVVQVSWHSCYLVEHHVLVLSLVVFSKEPVLVIGTVKFHLTRCKTFFFELVSRCWIFSKDCSLFH